MKQFHSLMNIIKRTLYFLGFVLCHLLVACCLMMARGCVYIIYDCGVYDPWLSSKLSLESELDLLKYCNIDILTLILMQNKLKCTSCCCMCLMLRKQKNWQKNFGELEVICQSFLPPKFLLYSITNYSYKYIYSNYKYVIIII